MRSRRDGRRNRRLQSLRSTDSRRADMRAGRVSLTRVGNGGRCAARTGGDGCGLTARARLRNPRVADGLIRLEAAIRIPCEAFRDEVDKKLVFRLEDLRERLGAGPTTTTFRVDNGPRRSGRVEKESLARAAIDEILVGNAKDLHDTGELLLLVLARKDRVASVHLGHDAPERPHLRG